MVPSTPWTITQLTDLWEFNFMNIFTSSATDRQQSWDLNLMARNVPNVQPDILRWEALETQCGSRLDDSFLLPGNQLFTLSWLFQSLAWIIAWRRTNKPGKMIPIATMCLVKTEAPFYQLDTPRHPHSEGQLGIGPAPPCFPFPSLMPQLLFDKQSSCYMLCHQKVCNQPINSDLDV